MGNECTSPLRSDNEQSLKSKRIDQEISLDARQTRHEQKLLLLGPGESGKSTIVKQLRIIYANCYQKAEERLAFKPNIFQNIASSMLVLVNSLPADQQAMLNPDELDCHQILNDNRTEESLMNPEVLNAVKILWRNHLIQKRFEERHETTGIVIQITDSAKFFFSEIERISKEDYVPTVEDLLLCRSQTTQITEVKISVGGYPMRFVDVGGQRTERDRWILIFNDVNAIFYVVALSEFDQKLREDLEVNRMIEAIQVFSTLCQQPMFRDTSIILFLNKSDQDGIDYFKQKFERASGHRHKLYTHVTTATSTENIRFVFEAIEDICIQNIFSEIVP
eukprot:TRINITY_DN623_c0_g1_i2.p1 TRINITY_DN623_c0_g1~~TRINITY_DN623_c0_g1_i2.p1  ORF type:complete len:335 (+),score=49.40 TRINITY_DN623_c0_g1_i2:64-1068(+)